jgi:serine/threonine protein phosphatase PrpC
MSVTSCNSKGKEYSFPFELHDVTDIEFENMPDGISYLAEEGMISGIPTVAGEHKITLRYVSNEHKVEKEILLIVNPDPKDLWKNEPASNTIKYYKPDCDHGSLFVKDGANMIAASQRGRSHAHEGKPRDDDFVLYYDNATEWYIMVVADGAGSAQFSREGSKIACQTALKISIEKLHECGQLLEEKTGLYMNDKEGERKDVYELLHKIVGAAAFEAHKAIYDEAAREQCKEKDYATTLILCICKRFNFGWFTGAFWVGDGGIGIYQKEKEVKILGESDGGEFAGQTRFITMKEVFNDRVRTRFEVVEDFTAIILMTDGVTDPKFETDANLNRIEKWDELWDDLNGTNEDSLKVDFAARNEQTAEQLLKWLDFWSKGNHDDRTIAILY